MTLRFLILTILFALTFASPVSIIKSSSITDNLSQLLYTHLTPILQNTLQQLIELVSELSEQFSQYIEHRSTRFDGVQPADWVSHLFNEDNSVSTQWNSHITDFFANIPTVYENDDRSLLDYSFIKQKLHLAMENLLKKLKKLFDTQINQLVDPIINEFNLTKSSARKYSEVDLNVLFNDFQRQVSGIFDETTEQLNHMVDDLIDSTLAYLNSLKDRFFG